MDMKHIDISVNGMDLNYRTARDIALSVAGMMEEEPSVVAWHDGPRKKMSPVIEGADISTRWRDYGSSHGGDLEVSINGDYDFIFADSAHYDTETPSPYVSVRDKSGREYMCLVSSLRDPTNPDEEACFLLDKDSTPDTARGPQA